MASMIFTDCTSTTTSRLLPFPGQKFRRIRRSVPFHLDRANPTFLRTITTTHKLAVSSSSHAVAMGTETSAKVIDGKAVAKQIRDEITAEISRMKDAIGVVPGLAVILVGDRKDSATYVRNKKKACQSVGINSYEVCLPEDSTEQEVLKYISDFNDDSSVHGILVQLPLPSREDATISIVHSRTKNPEDITRQADIIISAVGQPNMVRGSWIKPGAVIIDVGINPVEDANSPRGYRLVGDVCYEEACKIASAVTPVPGGVGPMTIAMLLSNTLTSAKRVHNFL
ncbi:bifunctional protein FolD 4, chloroplastic isoform X2 [Cornus florida]|uniref:bifunctional protein FolD 4, chloroplastic isoform X2 n=1 Tax=Cornus florida TaxID=4283 RepID=UPI00289A6D5D|nr:bifunctional protein FolD 4, chloroplastic isoform X2 [Cornus florida]